MKRKSPSFKSFKIAAISPGRSIAGPVVMRSCAFIAPAIIADKRKIYKGVSANVDFYSGLLYRILRIPNELYTPLFAIARMAGWGAHRLEELTNNGKIIRPGYQAVAPQREYKPIDRR